MDRLGRGGEGRRRGTEKEDSACVCCPWVLTADCFSLAPNQLMESWGRKGKERMGGWALGIGHGHGEKGWVKRHTFLDPASGLLTAV